MKTKTKKPTNLQILEEFSKAVIKSYLDYFHIPEDGYLINPNNDDEEVNLPDFIKKTAKKLKRDTFAAIYFNTDDPALVLQPAKTAEETAHFPGWDQLDGLASIYDHKIGNITYKIMVIEDF